MSMRVSNPFFTIGTVVNSVSNTPVTAGELVTAVDAMNAACYGPEANMARCAILSESLGRIQGTMAARTSSSAAATRSDAATGLAAVMPGSSLSGPTVMAALTALGSQPGDTGLARLC